MQVKTLRLKNQLKEVNVFLRFCKQNVKNTHR